MRDAEFKIRSLAFRLTSAAMSNRENKDAFPASIDAVKFPTIRDDDKRDPWGDEYLYFGNGKVRKFADRSKTLLLATAKPHEGKRVVAYASGDVESISEDAFQKMAK